MLETIPYTGYALNIAKFAFILGSVQKKKIHGLRLQINQPRLRFIINNKFFLMCVIADCGKRVLLSHLFDFVFREFRVQRFKHSTNMLPKSKSKKGRKKDTFTGILCMLKDLRLTVHHSSSVTFFP
jgi:hypothetical protein